MLASNYLDEEDRNKLFKSMEPFINFVKNETKASILCTGSISCGKSSLLNALLGNCILPSGTEETTEAITKLIPSQDLNSNTFNLTTSDGYKGTLNDMNLYRFLEE
jgi:predicted GTPase